MNIRMKERLKKLEASDANAKDHCRVVLTRRRETASQACARLGVPTGVPIIVIPEKVDSDDHWRDTVAVENGQPTGRKRL